MDRLNGRTQRLIRTRPQRLVLHSEGAEPPAKGRLLGDIIALIGEASPEERQELSDWVSSALELARQRK